jgi:CRISPR/Cas system-associated protein Cas10 (large subunit of type III CRISPR-Cas system)
MDLVNKLIQFKFTLFSFKYRCLEEIKLPAYKGSTIRGAFGSTSGIINTYPHYPVSFSVEQADKNLEKSKNFPGKNCIIIFQQTADWNEMFF